MSSADSIPEWLVILRPPRETFPADASPDEIAFVNAHIAYLTDLREAGTLILAGRTQEEENPIGLVILRAKDREAAERLMNDDPVISSGLFFMEVRPYEIALMGSE